MNPPYLIAAAILNAIAALLHIGCMHFGAPWYRFFGAGEHVVRLVEAGHWYPAALTGFIALVLTVWSLYALSAARITPPLPHPRTVLSLITAIYLLRGSAGIMFAALFADKNIAFWWWSSVICLGFGAVHLAGLQPPTTKTRHSPTL